MCGYNKRSYLRLISNMCQIFRLVFSLMVIRVHFFAELFPFPEVDDVEVIALRRMPALVEPAR